MTYGELAEAAWAWTLSQVQWDDEGPWIPEHLGAEKPTEYITGMHSGIGGLAYPLAEIRLSREWTTTERDLAAGIAARVRAGIPTESSITYFDGLVSAIGVLTALGEPGAEAAVDRALELATAVGWHEKFLDKGDSYLPDAICNDVTLGTGAVLLGSLWALRHGIPARHLADRAIDFLLAEQEETPTGLNWLFVPRRYLRTPPPLEMPNFSHGLAGISAVLALAGVELDRPELIDAARRGAEHLVTLGLNDTKGFRVARAMPWAPRHGDEYTYNWCHGPAGTSLLFNALEYAGVDQIADATPATWVTRCFTALRSSGIPARLHPGFWDNDGRCCGTAGVIDAALTAHDPSYAADLAKTLIANAHHEGPTAYWRFIEHTADDPLLPPGIGLMQGTAGIAATLFRLQTGRTVPHMANWWAL